MLRVPEPLRKKTRFKLKVNPYHPVSDTWKMKDKETVFFKVLPSQSKKVAVKRNHHSVRSAVVAHPLKHKEKYYAFWDKRNPHDQLMTDSSIEGVAEYLKMVSQMGQWARRACNNIAQTRTSLSL